MPKINEAGAGPSRIVTHIKDGVPFILVSAFRGNLPHHQNMRRNEMMRDAIKRFPGTSFIETSGEYHEMGAEEPSEEKSFFVMMRQRTNDPDAIEGFHQIGTDMMRMFNQDAIIVGDGEQVMMIERNGNSFKIGDAVSFSAEALKDAPGFTEIKKRRFTFVDRGDRPKAPRYGERR